jgi:hypothetical protein
MISRLNLTALQYFSRTYVRFSGCDELFLMVEGNGGYFLPSKLCCGMAKSKKLISKDVFIQRVTRSLLFGLLFLIIWLAIGMIGYRLTVPEFDWYDCLLNASMILSGMGPWIEAGITLQPKAKVFASVYAIFSGILFISVLAILIAPIAHRIFTKFHLEDEEE